MGKKYIIELLDDCPSEFKGIIVFGLTPEGQISAEPIPVEDLTPYTEPDLERIRKEAYDKGYDDAAEEKYNDGLADAWECARKVSQVRKYGGYGDCLEEVFGRHRVPWDVFDYSASEAIEKIRQYEQKQEEIKVGDEVENTQTGVKFIVTHLWENNHGEQGVSGFNQECSAFSTTLSLVVKTGRTFPEIATVLEKMKES